MKEFIWQMCHKPNMKRRVPIVILASIGVGFSLAWLIRVDMGLDPYTCFNQIMAQHIGITIGTWQTLFNCVLFVFVVLFGREYIGWGTVANMLLVGFSLDFFSWVLDRILPEDLFRSFAVRVSVLVPSLVLFVVVIALYVDMELGTSPYDAVPFLVAKLMPRVPFAVVRCAYDILFVVIAVALGNKIGIVTVFMAFLVGPVISWLGKIIQPWIGVEV